MSGENKIYLDNTDPDRMRERGRRGGIASGRTRRKKRELRKILEAALSVEYQYNERTMTTAEAICLALIEQALQGNVKAFVEIRDTVGEKPVTTQAINAEVRQLSIRWQDEEQAS